MQRFCFAAVFPASFPLSYSYSHMKRFFTFIILSFFALTSRPLRAQSAALESFLHRVMDSANVPGVSLAFIDKGKIIYSKGYGVLKKDTTAPVKPTTIFEAASLSKPVFAYTVLQLVDEGIIDLDKPLYEYLPYPEAEKDERYRKITARIVLSHQSGFPNWREDPKVLPLRFAPGARFGYSGEGFVYLQRVVEKLTHGPLDSLVRQKVFIPLGMHNSSYVWQKAFDDNYSRPHNRLALAGNKNKPQRANAASSLHTTADDYARFLVAFMKGKDLTKSSLQQLFASQIQLPARFRQTDSLKSATLFWGLGVGLEKNSSGNYAWHWGDNGSFKAFFMVDLNRQQAFVYFSNGSNGLGMADAITARLLKGDHAVIPFLGYAPYNSPSVTVDRYIIEKDSVVLQPYLNSTVLSEGALEDIGYTLTNAGYFSQAKAVFRHSMRTYPKFREGYFGTAYATIQSGNWVSALPYLEQWLAIKPDDDRVRKIRNGILASQQASGNCTVRVKGFPKAKVVTLTGPFNEWDRIVTFFVRQGDEWVCTFNVPAGKYPYKIAVDGKRMPDPGNPVTEPDGQGGLNSVLVVN